MKKKMPEVKQHQPDPGQSENRPQDTKLLGFPRDIEGDGEADTETRGPGEKSRRRDKETDTTGQQIVTAAWGPGEGED